MSRWAASASTKATRLASPRRTADSDLGVRDSLWPNWSSE